MRVLLTGDRGYIGAVLRPLLFSRGHQVVGLDAGFFDEHGAAGAEGGPRRDLRDIRPDDLVGFDAVLHLAALSNDPLGALDPEWTAAINLRASLALAQAAKQAGVGRFVFSSSCSVYGVADSQTLLHEDSPCQPLTAYARSKLAVEEGLDALAGAGFAPVSLRHATAHGMSPRVRLDLVLNNFVGWACATGVVRLESDGQAIRPMVHVRDIAAAFVAMLDAPVQRIAGQRFNVGCNAQNFRIVDLARVVCDVVPGTRLDLGHGRPSDARSYRVSFDRIARTLPEFAPAWDVQRSARELFAALSPLSLTRDRLASREFVRVAQIEHLLQRGQLDRDLRWQDAACP